MTRTNKAAYKKHQWSGGKRKRRQVQAALQHHYGTNSRNVAWRNVQMNNPPDVTMCDDPSNAQTVINNGSTNAEIPLKTYANKNPPTVRFEAPITSTSSTPRAVGDEAPAKQVEVNWPNPDPDVESHQLLVETVPHETLGDLSGYRIVDINHVLQWAFIVERHKNSCPGSTIKFVKETRNGFNSVLTFQCQICGKVFKNSTEKNEDINKAFVWGTVSAGSYYAATAHLTSCMDIPTMSSNKFRSIEKELGEVWENHLTEVIMKAGQEERDIAIQKGQINENGLPYTTVYLDGGWLKRSYGHNYNSSSGMACIIGKETKKCLFLGIRNKYCYHCQYYEKKNMKPTEHVCFKNFNGPSTAMEADIVIEGFKKSEEMHGLQYKSFIGDGDSSVYAHIKKNIPYGHKVTKIECKNHLVKNYTAGLYKILTNTKLPLLGRNMLKPRIENLTIVTRKVIIHCHKDPNRLRKDLKNVAYHVYGRHMECQPYYCNYTEANDEHPKVNEDKDLVTIMTTKAPGVWANICAANEHILSKSHRVSNETTNVAENFMSLVNKFTCGKRLSLGKGGSYQRRVLLAGLSQTTGYSWHKQAWLKTSSHNIGQHFQLYIKRKELIRMRRQRCPRTRNFKPTVIKPDKDYGPKACDPVDLSREDIKRIGQEKLMELQVTPDQIAEIEQQTKDQHDNELYNVIRSDRLTASQFGMVCKRRNKTPCHNHVKQILYKNNILTSDMKYGQHNEAVARTLFETTTNKKVERAGLFIDKQYGFLGASPDGIIIDENALLEIKCFPSLKRSQESIETAAESRGNKFCLKYNKEGKLVMNTNHNYYYQVQGQLRIADMAKCYFVCFIDPGINMTIIEVDRDEDFIHNMIPKLVSFYKNCIVPELILRRVPKNQKCVEISDLPADHQKQ
ncbi:uncharacterized protein LOC134678669 isoform X2 [Cydia fagiglandana]